MGTRRKTSQTTGGRGVTSAEGVSDLEEKEQKEQQKLINTLIGTIHHYFGGFSPSVWLHY